MDTKLTDKEEIKRKLEEMKMKYAKMQKKLTKSESRKHAKNHVRRIVAEQGNAPSPELYFITTSNPKESSYETIDSPEKRENRSEAEMMTGKSSKINPKSLRKSISFKLEDSPVENETDGFHHSTLSVDRQESLIMRYHETVQSSIDVLENKSCHSGSTGLSKEIDCGDKQSLKLSRLSHNKNTRRKRRRRKTDSAADHSNVGEDSNSCLDERGSPSLEVGLSPNCTPSATSESTCNTERRQLRDARPVNEIKDEVKNTKDTLSLRHLGVLQTCDPSFKWVSWDGICLHTATTYTALIVHHSQTAVLWLHTETWEARSQWSADQDVSIIHVVIDSTIESQLSIVFTLKKTSENELCFVTHNFEKDTEKMRMEKLSGRLQEAESISVLLNGADRGAVMEGAGSSYRHIHFFDIKDNFKLWQVKCLEGVEANSFISVKGASNIYLCLSSCHLSLWTPESAAPVLNVNLADSPGKIQVDRCLWSKAEEGLLFIISLQGPSNLSLSVLNPATKTVLQITSFKPPSSYRSLRIVDTALSERFLSVLFSNQKALIWDILTGQPLAEVPCPDEETSQIASSSKFLVLNGKDPHLFLICK